MNNFIFENSTKVFFGKGCVKEYLCCLTKAYGDTVMLCYGGGSIKKNGIYDEVTNILEAAGKTVVEFSGIMANPTYAKVLEGAKLAKKNDVSLILLPKHSSLPWDDFFIFAASGTNDFAYSGYYAMLYFYNGLC